MFFKLYNLFSQNIEIKIYTNECRIVSAGSVLIISGIKLTVTKDFSVDSVSSFFSEFMIVYIGKFIYLKHST